MREVIVNKIREIEEKENVKIIMAVESGSRSWGFASPDSDYDVRFLYVRREADYLRLEGIRDVIEWQLDEVLDISGWDIQKALRLLHKSNPSVFEWCTSPIYYYKREEAEELKQLLPEYFSCKKGIYHYWHMAEYNYKNYIKKEQVPIKKYFYVLRPLLAAKWILDEKSIPPILFSKLVETKLDSSMKPIVSNLLWQKSEMKEMGLCQESKELNVWIEKEMERLKQAADHFLKGSDQGWEKLNQYFLSLVGE